MRLASEGKGHGFQFRGCRPNATVVQSWGGFPCAANPPGVALNSLSLIDTLMIIRALLLTFLLSSCVDNWLVGFAEDTNYLTFDHPNSEKAIVDVRSRAERLCQQRKQVAIKTESACSLTKCATNYQCVDPADALKYGL